VPNMHKAILSVHCHNDLGVGTANSLMAIRNGAQQIECTMNGIGERAGNAALEEVIMALQTRNPEFEVETGIDTTQIYPTSRMLTEITSMDVQVNKAIVGLNAFAHEAGIHQDGVLKNPQTYEIMTPASVGLASNNIVLGKHSGRRALGARLQRLGYELSKEEMNDAYEAFIVIADHKKVVVDEDLVGMAANGFRKNGSHPSGEQANNGWKPPKSAEEGPQDKREHNEHPAPTSNGITQMGSSFTQESLYEYFNRT